MLESIISFMNDPSGIKTLGKQLNSSKYQVIAEVREGFDELKEELAKPMQQVMAEYEAKLKAAEKKAEFYCMSLTNIGDVIPDMLWFKYTDGKYAYANKALRDGLLFDDAPIGKDDMTIGARAIEIFGVDNHDFGGYCAGSDVVTIEHGHRKRFIEYGVSGGIPLVLEVFKNVVRDKNDEVIGTVGSGRDITHMIFTMLALVECHSESPADKNSQVLANSLLDAFLDLYLYENTGSGVTLQSFYNTHKDRYHER